MRRRTPILGELTEREREVAGLVARGLSNKQLAHRLHIAQRTAESHVERILAKWGLHSRVEIAIREQTGDVMRLHQRTLTVQRANAALTGKLWDIQDKLGLVYAEAMIAVATHQANIVRTALGRPTLGWDSVSGTVPGHAEVAAAATEAQQDFFLTDVELLGLFAEHQQRIAKYMLREERHPGNPEMKADEAGHD